MNLNSISDSYQLTTEGYQELKFEWQKWAYKKKQLVNLLEDHWDNTSNLDNSAELLSAEEEKEFIDQKLAEVEHMLTRSKVVKPPVDKDHVDVGSKVTVQNGHGKLTIKIVGSAEANPIVGKVSDSSPLGQALLGKNEKAEFSISTPSGKHVYRVIKIHPPPN